MCLHSALCSIPINWICNMNRTKYMTFDSTQGVESVCKDNHVLTCCCICHSATGSCSKKVEFGPFDPTPRVKGRGLTGKIFADVLLHASIPLI